MKRAIFLLAFCAFETVFADDQFENILNNFHIRNKNNMDGLMEKLHNDIEVVMNELGQKGIHLRDAINYCWKDYNILLQFKRTIYDRIDSQCYNKAAENKNFEFMEKCYSFQVNTFQHQIKIRRSSTKKCIANNLYLLGPQSQRKFYQIPL